MNWTKTVKEFAILLFLVLCGLALLGDLVSLIRYHGSFFSTIINFAEEVGGYMIRIGAVLILAEISENVFAIRNGEKAVAAAPKPTAKPAAKQEAKPAEDTSAEVK